MQEPFENGGFEMFTLQYPGSPIFVWIYSIGFILLSGFLSFMQVIFNSDRVNYHTSSVLHSAPVRPPSPSVMLWERN